jgi:type II secretory pathway pseudopilin PulG
MSKILITAAAAAVALPVIASAPANAQYSNNRNYNRELRECNRELRRADNRAEYRRELRECRREIARARHGYNDRGWYGRDRHRYWDGRRWRDRRY